MFGGPFNRLPFNRLLSIETFFTVTFETGTEFESRLNLEMPLSVVFDIETDFTANMTREIQFSAMFNTSTELVTKMIRERIMAVVFDNKTEFTAKQTLYRIDEIEFVGPFAPGDRIVMDSVNLKLTQNGANALHKMRGDFFDLNLGTNNLVYTDPATKRDMLIRITWPDKFV